MTNFHITYADRSAVAPHFAVDVDHLSRIANYRLIEVPDALADRQIEDRVFAVVACDGCFGPYYGITMYDARRHAIHYWRYVMKVLKYSDDDLGSEDIREMQVFADHLQKLAQIEGGKFRKYKPKAKGPLTDIEKKHIKLTHRVTKAIGGSCTDQIIAKLRGGRKLPPLRRMPTGRITSLSQIMLS